MSTGLQSQARSCLLNVPAEIRYAILENVFDEHPAERAFQGRGTLGGLCLDGHYKVRGYLQPLLACRQLYQDASLLALTKALFVVSNLFLNIPERLSVLHPKQIASIRSITFVADSRHFKRLLDWGGHPFGLSSLNLHTLTIALHRSSAWHYMFDFTADIVKLLRNLVGVKKLVFVKNFALVKGSFRTWYNRLVGLIMKVDHQERYDRSLANPEKTWWTWKYDDLEQSFCLEAKPAKPMVDEESYMQQAVPLMEELRESMEKEEWNPDPRSRMMYY